MKVKFNKFERVAGIFVVTAFLGAIGLTALTAIRKGWFAEKIEFTTHVNSAEGLRAGTPVTISGIRAGEVTAVELQSANRITVHFEIFQKFHQQLRADSRAQVIRPFIIGDKIIEVTVGSEQESVLAEKSEIISVETMDMMDLFSGKKLGPFLGTMEGLMGNLSRLAQAFADPKRTESFVKMFDRMDPLIMNLGKMAKEVNVLASELNQILPGIRQASPQVGMKMGELIGQLNALTTALTPAFNEISPDLPRVSRRAVEALDEMVVTLKALQKSFVLSGNVKEVKEEERERKRAPANQ